MAPSRTYAVMWGVGLALLAARSASAQDGSPGTANAVEAGAETDLGSLYLFRGLVYSAGPVAQSRAWLSADGFDLYGWTNVALPAATGARTLDEVDAGASYRIEHGRFAAVPALDVYLYRLADGQRANGAASRTIEASLALSYTRGGTAVTSKHVVDAGSYRGAYVTQVGASHTQALTSRADVEVAALVGWASRRFNRSYVGSDVRGIGVAAVSVSVTRRVGRRWYFRPHAEVSVVPSSQLRAALSRPFNVVLGLAVGAVR